jgi:adenylate cyclase
VKVCFFLEAGSPSTSPCLLIWGRGAFSGGLSEGHRRLAAIMFTDMVGYTALGQRNESLSLALVEEQRKVIRPILARHNGKEVKTIGDGFLVEFGSALEAARCAYEIQRATKEFNLPLEEDKRIHLRIGVHLGDVVEYQGDISGDAVNVASRIELLAEDGGVCVTRQVYDQVKGKLGVQFSSLGSKSLKNVGEPVEVYKLVLPWEKEAPAAPTQLERTRVAVLPFANMSPDPNDEFFADGMTEELISTLSKIKGFSVISRTSVMHFKGRGSTTAEIAKELYSGSLLEGSVRRAGNRVRVTVQLVDGSTDTHMWVANYDRQLKDVFAMQTDIATSVADSLKVQLLPDVVSKIKTKDTGSAAAHDYYLKGISHLREGTERGVHLAREQFEKALREDQNYARAYAGLADSALELGDYLFSPVPTSINEARGYIEKALALDPDLAEARVSLATLLMYDYRFSEAESEFLRAIEASPSNASAHQRYATCIQTFGRWLEALKEVLRAEELDPLSPAIQLSVIYRLRGLGKDEESERRIRRLEETAPQSPLVEEAKMVVSFAKKDWDKAEFHLKKMMEADPADPYLDADMAFLYAVTGRRDEALRLVDKLERVPEDARIKGQLLGFAYLGLGNVDETFRWLNYAVEKKESFIAWVRSYPLYAPLREDPRFNSLLAAAGLRP